MSQTIGIYEMKNHFTELLRQVQTGNVLHITRHGAPIATLSPYQTPKKETANTIRALEALSAKISLKKINVKSLIESGRK